jgi:hypothetical protein
VHHTAATHHKKNRENENFLVASLGDPGVELTWRRKVDEVKVDIRSEFQKLAAIPEFKLTEDSTRVESEASSGEPKEEEVLLAALRA